MDAIIRADPHLRLINEELVVEVDIMIIVVHVIMIHQPTVFKTVIMNGVEMLH